MSDTTVSKRTYGPFAAKPDDTSRMRYRAVHTGEDGMQFTVRESFKDEHGRWFTSFTTYEV